MSFGYKLAYLPCSPDSLTHFSDSTLERPFAPFESKVHEIKEYVAKWLQIQSL
ncbi:hypothetical protein FA95DRAFT_368631 [Auriscalpium vulgare]|uniref:Uncharacterized protein n=1 Tax=Auriscalpium vulgare TaxID=40419 RepID=A0ACB8RJ62_9AGAM|nr:hypothetical protein FA95DRAFT_368631 [Auriscalpium vulgare]